MPKVFLKVKYPKSSSAAQKYLNYIATRDGVQFVYPDKNIASTDVASQKQISLISELTQEYPDLKQLHEYSDFKVEKSKYYATEFLNVAFRNIQLEHAPADKYLQYISERPGVEKIGTDGLFNASGKADLGIEKQIIANYSGRVWHLIISLKREDAENIGLDNPESWRLQLNKMMPGVAHEMGIAIQNVHWNAAFHNEGHHPHVHVSLYSLDDTEIDRKFIRSEDIRNIRTRMTKDIFKEELKYLYEEKNVARENLENNIYKELDVQKDKLLGKHAKIDSETMNMITDALEKLNFTGRQYYEYLPPEHKVLIDSILESFSKHNMKDFFSAYMKAEMDIREMYHDVKDGEQEGLLQKLLHPGKSDRKVLHNTILDMLKEMKELQELATSPISDEEMMFDEGYYDTMIEIDDSLIPQYYEEDMQNLVDEQSYSYTDEVFDEGYFDAIIIDESNIPEEIYDFETLDIPPGPNLDEELGFENRKVLQPQATTFRNKKAYEKMIQDTDTFAEDAEMSYQKMNEYREEFYKYHESMASKILNHPEAMKAFADIDLIEQSHISLFYKLAYLSNSDTEEAEHLLKHFLPALNFDDLKQQAETDLSNEITEFSKVGLSWEEQKILKPVYQLTKQVGEFDFVAYCKMMCEEIFADTTELDYLISKQAITGRNEVDDIALLAKSLHLIGYSDVAIHDTLIEKFDNKDNNVTLGVKNMHEILFKQKEEEKKRAEKNDDKEKEVGFTLKEFFDAKKVFAQINDMRTAATFSTIHTHVSSVLFSHPQKIVGLEDMFRDNLAIFYKMHHLQGILHKLDINIEKLFSSEELPEVQVELEKVKFNFENSLAMQAEKNIIDCTFTKKEWQTIKPFYEQHKLLQRKENEKHEYYKYHEYLAGHLKEMPMYEFHQLVDRTSSLHSIPVKELLKPSVLKRAIKQDFVFALKTFNFNKTPLVKREEFFKVYGNVHNDLNVNFNELRKESQKMLQDEITYCKENKVHLMYGYDEQKRLTEDSSFMKSIHSANMVSIVSMAMYRLSKLLMDDAGGKQRGRKGNQHKDKNIGLGYTKEKDRSVKNGLSI